MNQEVLCIEEGVNIHLKTEALNSLLEALNSRLYVTPRPFDPLINTRQTWVEAININTKYTKLVISSYGVTPSETECARFLIKNGADLYACDKQLATPSALIQSFGSLEARNCIDKLIPESDGVDMPDPIGSFDNYF